MRHHERKTKITSAEFKRVEDAKALIRVLEGLAYEEYKRMNEQLTLLLAYSTKELEKRAGNRWRPEFSSIADDLRKKLKAKLQDDAGLES